MSTLSALRGLNLKLNVNQSIIEAPRRVPIGAEGITVEDEASLWIDYCVYIGSHKSGIMLCMGFPCNQGSFLCPQIACCSNLPKFHRIIVASPNKAIVTAYNSDPLISLDDPRESGSTVRPNSTTANFSWGGFRVGKRMIVSEEQRIPIRTIALGYTGAKILLRQGQPWKIFQQGRIPTESRHHLMREA